MNSYSNRMEDRRHVEGRKNDLPEAVQLQIPGLSKSFSLVEFIPKEASDRLWSAYFSLLETVFRELNLKRRLPSRDRVRRRLSTINPLYTVKRWMVMDEVQCAVASASLSYDTELSPDYETSSHIGHVQVEVLPLLRRKKIATRLMKQMIDKARAFDKDTVRADADNPAGRAFCNRLKGERIHKEVQHRLYLEDAEWQVADQWREKGRKHFPETTFETFQDCPDKDIDEFCRIYTEIINQRPVGDIQEALITTPESRRVEEGNFRRRGTEWHTMISREPDGRISAMTDIMYNPHEPYRIQQYFTGVLTQYRRRGLAKRLKAEMLYYITERFPEAEYITTTTASDNKPMQAINRQLGFMPKKTYYMFRWALQDLDRRVDKILSAPASAHSTGRKR
jgi:GNAT superfamily N-acetyltransferase